MFLNSVEYDKVHFQNSSFTVDHLLQEVSGHGWSPYEGKMVTISVEAYWSPQIWYSLLLTASMNQGMYDKESITYFNSSN